MKRSLLPDAPVHASPEAHAAEPGREGRNGNRPEIRPKGRNRQKHRGYANKIIREEEHEKVVR